MQIPENILVLIEKYHSGTATVQEKLILNQWYHSFNDKEAFIKTDANDSSEILGERIKIRLNETLQNEGAGIGLNRKKKTWLPDVVAAASLLIMVSFSAYFLFPSKTTHEKTAIAKPIKETLKNDRAPGSNKAVLTLADGNIIELDSAANGTLYNQGNIKIQKTNNGQLAYNKSAQPVNENDATYFNTITTPRGGQYQVKLADGTKVWLNAGSSIRFPVVFADGERKVEITGEAYFEVAHVTSKDRRKRIPFIVDIKTPSGNGEQIEVLGTHFNINAYTDETFTRTTLLQGKVKVKRDNRSTTLLPGQQAQVNKKGEIRLLKEVNLQEEIAWKDGLFIMNKADIASVMRKIARWYDVEIVYEDSVPSGKITGDMPMNMKLSKMLEVLELVGVHFSIEGNKVLVKP